MIIYRENAHILRVCSAFLDKLSFNLTSNLKSRGLFSDLAGTTDKRTDKMRNFYDQNTDRFAQFLFAALHFNHHFFFVAISRHWRKSPACRL
jgi:hypothetical protein